MALVEYLRLVALGRGVLLSHVPLVAVAIFRFGPRALLLASGALWAIGLVPPVIYAVNGLDEAWKTRLLYNPLLRLPEFMMGLATGRLFLLARRAPTMAVRPAQRPRLYSILSLPAILTVLMFEDRVPSILLHNGLLDPLFAVLIYRPAAGTGPIARVLSWRPLVVLGEASYSIYILQSPVFIWMKGAVALAAFGNVLGGEASTALRFRLLPRADRRLGGHALLVRDAGAPGGEAVLRPAPAAAGRREASARFVLTSVPFADDEVLQHHRVHAALAEGVQGIVERRCSGSSVPRWPHRTSR